MEGRVLNRAARDQEFIEYVERASGEKASDYESNEAFLEHIASNVYDNIIEIVHSLLKKEDEDWEAMQIDYVGVNMNGGITRRFFGIVEITKIQIQSYDR